MQKVENQVSERSGEGVGRLMIADEKISCTTILTMDFLYMLQHIFIPYKQHFKEGRISPLTREKQLQIIRKCKRDKGHQFCTYPETTIEALQANRVSPLMPRYSNSSHLTIELKRCQSFAYTIYGFKHWQLAIEPKSCQDFTPTTCGFYH